MDERERLLDAVEPPVDAIHTRGMGGQFDMDMREISLDRAHPTDELVELTFNALQTSTHIAQEREHETVGLVGHDQGKTKRSRRRPGQMRLPADPSRPRAS